MTKLGRNERCHCGSGKKYKKCCLDADQAKQAAATQPEPSEEDILFQDESEDIQDEVTDWGEPEPEYYAADDFSRDITRESSGSVFQVDDITSEQDDVVYEWLEAHYSLQEPEEIAQSLKSFLAKHPELAGYVGASTTTLLELKGSFLEKDALSEYIDLILWLRENCPAAYIHFFEYLDLDIISYLLTTGEIHKTDKFLGLFREHPTNDSDMVADVLDLLMSRDIFDTAHKLAGDAYQPVYSDSEVEVWPGLLQILVMGCLAPHLDAASKGKTTEHSIRELITCLKPYRNVLPEKWYTIKYLQSLMDGILNNQNTRWTLNGCTTRAGVIRRYNEMLLGFTGYIAGNKNLHWATADYYRLQLSDFLDKLVPKAKTPKDNFPLTRQHIRKTLLQFSRSIFGFRTCKLFSTLNALYMLADYLVYTGSIDRELGDDVQKWCREIHAEPLENKRDVDILALPYRDFPLFP